MSAYSVSDTLWYAPAELLEFITKNGQFIRKCGQTLGGLEYFS